MAWYRVRLRLNMAEPLTVEQLEALRRADIAIWHRGHRLSLAVTFDALHAFLDQEQIIELVLNVAFYNMMVRAIVPLEIDWEPDAHENRYNLDHVDKEAS